MHAGGGLLGDALPAFDHGVPEGRALLEHALEQVLDHLLLVRGSLLVDPLAAVLQLIALVDQQGHVAAVVDDELRAEEAALAVGEGQRGERRSEEHTSELQSLMRISYAVFCLKQKKKT